MKKHKTSNAIKKSKGPSKPRINVRRNQLFSAVEADQVPPCLNNINLTATAERAGLSRQTAYRYFESKETFVETFSAWLHQRLSDLEELPELSSFKKMDSAGPLPTFYTEKVQSHLSSESFVRLFFCSLMEGNALDSPYVKRQITYFRKGIEEGVLAEELDEEAMAIFTIVALWLAPYLLKRSKKSEKKQEEMVETFFKTYRHILHHGMFKK